LFSVDSVKNEVKTAPAHWQGDIDMYSLADLIGVSILSHWQGNIDIYSQGDFTGKSIGRAISICIPEILSL
jgi:hypothetical protein